LNQNTSNLRRIHVDLGSLMFLSKKEVSLWFFTWFYSEIWIRIFGIPWFDSVLHWFLFEIRNWTGDTLLLLRWLKIFEILSLFFPIFLFCDRAWVRYPWWWIRAWIVGEISSMMKIHLWISESSHEFHEFWPELNSGKLGFVELFFNFSELVVIWSNWIERESWKCVCDVAFNPWLFSNLYSAWPYIGCHVAFEPMRMWHLALDCPRGLLDKTVKKDSRTKMQFKKNLGLNCN